MRFLWMRWAAFGSDDADPMMLVVLGWGHERRNGSPCHTP